MRVQKVRKTKKYLKAEPNLKNYSATYRKFRWEDHVHEVEWFERKRGLKGKINAAYNAVDRHVKSWRKNKVALFWEGANGEQKTFTFAELSALSNKFANVLTELGVKKGDRVFLLLPRIPELYISFLGIVKTGAIAGTMFAAFGPAGIKDRLQDSGASVLVTNSELLKRVNAVKKHLPALKKIIVTDLEKHKGNNLLSYNQLMQTASRNFKVRKTDGEDAAFMLYTSGTTGKPKGVVHAHLSILQHHMTSKWILDLRDEDVFWCTADPGWVTGVAYGILGSWSNGSTNVVYGGRFSPEKWYGIIEKYRVTVWYTAPTAVRMLMAAGNELPKKFDLSSLRHMCSVGEPLNPEPIRWALKVFGLPFHDTWWQTETGGIMIANYACMDIKMGSMGKPFPGVKAEIVDDNGKALPAFTEGHLALKPPWPSIMRKIWKNPKKYRSYFNAGWYISGDRAFKDKDGYFWFIGRADDVINTAGERVGPFEIESALIDHPAVVEAAVIGKPDPLRGEIVKAFVVLAKGYKPSEKLKNELKQFVKKNYAGHAYPREIEFRKELPKTQSGKIMRRVLKAQELGIKLGDTSTMKA